MAKGAEIGPNKKVSKWRRGGGTTTQRFDKVSMYDMAEYIMQKHSSVFLFSDNDEFPGGGAVCTVVPTCREKCPVVHPSIFPVQARHGHKTITRI